MAANSNLNLSVEEGRYVFSDAEGVRLAFTTIMEALDYYRLAASHDLQNAMMSTVMNFLIFEQGAKNHPDLDVLALNMAINTLT